MNPRKEARALPALFHERTSNTEKISFNLRTIVPPLQPFGVRLSTKFDALIGLIHQKTVKQPQSGEIRHEESGS